MSNNSQSGCTRKCWTASAVVGAVVFLALTIGGYGIFASVVLGLIAFALLGFLLVWLACSESPRATPAGDSRSVSGTAAAAGTSAAASPAAAVVSPTPPAEPAPEPEPEPVSEQAAIAERAVPEASPEEAEPVAPVDVPRGGAEPEEEAAPEEGADTPAERAEPETETPARSDMATAPDTQEAGRVPLVKPSTPLAGQAELAARKGSWKYERS